MKTKIKPLNSKRPGAITEAVEKSLRGIDPKRADIRLRKF